MAGPTRIYRAAHGKLIASFVERGLLSRKSVIECGVPFQSISNEEIEARRAETVIGCGPGGTLHDYVPFHFGPRSPMMYRISRRNLPNYTEGQRPLIYLVSSVERVIAAGLRFVLTDGHPLATITDTYDEVARLDQVDFPLMREAMWKDTDDDPDRERRRQAEFLVHQVVPWQLVDEIGVMDGQVKKRVEELLKNANAEHRPNVVVRGAWYYREER